MRYGWMLVGAWVVACGPSVGGMDEGSADGSGSSGSTGTSSTSTSSSTTADAVTTAPPGTAEATTVSADESSTGEAGCIEGVFEGTWYAHFEGQSFVPCDHEGEAWFFEDGSLYAMHCPGGAWMRIEGRVCTGLLPDGSFGPGLEGTILEGPCIGACGEAPSSCGSVEEVCGFEDCSVALQDCALGDRCQPYAPGGGPPWTGSACVPEPAMPQPLGAQCTRTAAWDDDCAAGGFCRLPELGAGTCVAICDPLAPACGDGEACQECEWLGISAFGVCADTPVEC